MIQPRSVATPPLYNFGRTTHSRLTALFALTALLAFCLLNPSAQAFTGRDESGVPYDIRCKKEFASVRTACSGEGPKTDPHVTTLTGCKNGVEKITMSFKAVSADDDSKLGAHKRCVVTEMRSNGDRFTKIFTSLGTRLSINRYADGSGENVIYPKGGGMIECSFEKGEEKYSWCGINGDKSMMNKSGSYDFLIKRPTDAEMDQLLAGKAEIATLFPTSRRTLTDPKWHIHATQAAPAPPTLGSGGSSSSPSSSATP